MSLRSGYFSRMTWAAALALFTEAVMPEPKLMCSRSPFCSCSSKNSSYWNSLIWEVVGMAPPSSSL